MERETRESGGIRERQTEQAEGALGKAGKVRREGGRGKGERGLAAVVGHGGWDTGETIGDRGRDRQLLLPHSPGGDEE